MVYLYLFESDKLVEKKLNNEILDGGDELFSHPAVIEFYNNVMNDWKSDGKPIALLLGCTADKPYSNSFMHKKVIGMFQKHEFDDMIQQYIIGEPLVVCPREWEKKYPAAHYDFPPKRLTEEGVKVFEDRLKNFFKKFGDKYKKFLVFAPNHHKKIILAASEDLTNISIVPYNLYKFPDLLSAIQESIKEVESCK